MILIKATTPINLPGGIIKQPGDVFMCKEQFANNLIASKSAELANNSASIEDTPYKKMTVKELKQYAIDHEIEIPSEVTKKDDILSLIEGAFNGEKDI